MTERVAETAVIRERASWLKAPLYSGSVKTTPELHVIKHCRLPALRAEVCWSQSETSRWNRAAPFEETTPLNEIGVSDPFKGAFCLPLCRGRRTGPDG